MQIKNIIPRNIYLDKITPFIGKSLIKVLIGQRRVGKSYLLLKIMQQIEAAEEKPRIIYINKEDLAFSTIKNADDLHAYIQQEKSSTQKSYVFIDEIQEIENFEVALRSLLLDEQLDIYCTGSNAKLLSQDVAGYLSGRSIEINVYSLSYLEFLDFMGIDDDNTALENYLKYGGFPYIKDLPLSDDIIFEYLKNIYSTIVIRDVVNRYGIRNAQFLEQLVQFLASNIGSLFSAKKISDFLKSQKITTSPTQVQNYVSYLSNAFLIHQVKRYDIEGKRVFEIGEKYYFENLGIRNALLGYRLQDRGKLLENTVFNHLKIAGYAVKIGGLSTQEIDFVAEKNGETLYVQVALSINEEKTLQREFGNLLLIKDNYPKFVVTMDEFNGNTYEGIICLSLRAFIRHLFSCNWKRLILGSKYF